MRNLSKLVAVCAAMLMALPVFVVTLSSIAILVTAGICCGIWDRLTERKPKKDPYHDFR